MLYQFYKDDVVVGTKVAPNWIVLQNNGCYGLCDFNKCEGVAINGTPYHLEGREGLSDLETVTYKMITEQEFEEQIRKEQQELLDIITGEVTTDENTDEG